MLRVGVGAPQQTHLRKSIELDFHHFSRLLGDPLRSKWRYCLPQSGRYLTTFRGSRRDLRAGHFMMELHNLLAALEIPMLQKVGSPPRLSIAESRSASVLKRSQPSLLVTEREAPLSSLVLVVFRVVHPRSTGWASTWTPVTPCTPTAPLLTSLIARPHPNL